MTELEQLKQIIKDAPEGATHYIGKEVNHYWKLTYINGYQCFLGNGNLINRQPKKLFSIHSLSDIRERISLMKKLEKCKDLIRILTPYMESDSAKVNAKKLIGELNG